MRTIGKSILSVFILTLSLYSSICIYKLFSISDDPDKYLAFIAGYLTWLVPVSITLNSVLGLNIMSKYKKLMTLIMISTPYSFIISIIENYS